MRKFLLKYGKVITVIFTVVFGFILLISAITMLSRYRDEIANVSSSKAQYYTLIARNSVENQINDKISKAKAIANTVADIETEKGAYDYLASLGQKSDYSNIYQIKYYIGDTLYSSDNNEYLDEDLSRSHRELNPTVAGYIGSFEISTNEDGLMTVLAFYAPCNDSKLIDAVVIYYTRSIINEFLSTYQTNDFTDFTILCTKSGKIVSNDSYFNSSDLVYSLKQKIGDKKVINQISDTLQSGKDGTIVASIGNEDYVLSFGAKNDTMHDLVVVELYNVNKLCASSFEFVHSIIGIIILFAVIAIAIVIYLVIRDIIIKRQLFNMEIMDKQLLCFNRYGFEKEAKKIIDRNENSYFALVVISIKHFKFLLESYGESEVFNLLSYMKLTVSKTIQIEETFGRLEEGDFVLLAHARDRQGLIDRLKVNSFLLSRYKGSHDVKISCKYGIYEIDENENITVSQMIDFANEANNTITHVDLQNADQTFNFYDDELRKIRIINETMELQMEDALTNNEFQVFYQPKYSLKNNCQDGCEALVRWYDPKTGEYNKPALFMQLFESNGFITKLDRYVYTKVCEYINYSIAHGLKLFPVSVNISRVTAIQPDFIEFYTKIKKKYGVPDGYLMIEFTESFAYENYVVLGDIIDKLHQNGFKCSLDDFGCGYSSYRVLKELPMDEIKLDRFFLEKGKFDSRDKYIFESVISLAKNLGMKVTQEGTETLDDIKLLKDFECDTIQGYYYSRPIPLTDYLNFVEHTKEHNIKYDVVEKDKKEEVVEAKTKNKKSSKK